jgi:hypothetical protein
MGVGYNTRVVTENLQVVVDPGNPKGIADLVGKSALSFLGDAPQVASIGGTSAFVFTGQTSGPSNRLIRVENVLFSGVSDGSWCMETWCRPTDTANQNIVHMSGGNDGTGWCLPPLHINTGIFRGLLWQNGAMFVVGPSVVANQWIHLTLAWDLSNNLRLFVNGSLYAQNTDHVNYTASGTNNFCFIGGAPVTSCSNNQQRNFAGGIGYFSFKNRAVTVGEVRQNFNALRGRFGI